MATVIKGNNIGAALRQALLKKRITRRMRRIIANIDGKITPVDPKKSTSTTSTQVTGTTTTSPGNTTTTVAEPAPPVTTTPTATLISETSIMWMRAKTITFQATGLKPNTRYFPFFNGVYVGQYCSTTDGALTSTITTNTNGDITGNFYLPGGTFTTGSHKFQLVDAVDNEVTPTKADPLYGLAEAIYDAQGTLKLMQGQATTTTPVENTAPVAPPQTVNPTSTATSTPATVRPEGCEEWHFEYRVVRPQAQKLFTITSSEKTPPANPKHNTGGGVAEKSTEALTVTYVGTTINSAGNYNHQFTYTELNVASVKRQLWRGPAVLDPATELPDLASFRPSGVRATDVVNIVKTWTRSTFGKKNETKVTCPAKAGLYTAPRKPSDPLAQSFYVDVDTHPKGMFITSIDVYFKTVDQSTPVALELRNMTNGLPGPNILPNGRVMLQGTAAGQSDDATVATTFRFDSPIFLQPQTDYCFVVRSTSLGYNAWCSRVGEKDVTTGQVIDTNPYIGSLFKSENDDTWVPDSFEDMKFNVNVAVFDTTANTALTFRPQKDAVSNNYYATKQTLPLSYLSTTFNTRVIKANIPMHGLVTGDKIYIPTIATPTPVSGYNNIRAEQLTGEFTITRVDDDNLTFNANQYANDSIEYKATRSGPLLVRDIAGLVDITPAILPAQQTVTLAAPVTNPGTFSPTTIPAAEAPSVAPTPPSFVSTTTFTVYTNLVINEVMIDYLGTEFPEAEIVERVKVAVGAPQLDAGDSPYTGRGYIEINKDGHFHMFEEPRALASPRNEEDHAAQLGTDGKSLVVKVEMNSSDKSLSPIIDTNGMSLVARSYKIDNQNDEINILVEGVTDPTSPYYPKVEADFNDPIQNTEITSGKGTAAAKYKSTLVQMKEFFKKIDIYITGNCPAPAQFDCYIRTSTDAATHIDRTWTWVPLDGVFGTAFPYSSDKYVTNEWNFEHTAANSFNVFDIKLVMRTTNPSTVPKIVGIRTIADLSL